MKKNDNFGEMLIGALEEAVEHYQGCLSRQRMLAARDRVRRNFSPESMADTDPESAEVVGGSTPKAGEPGSQR